MLELLIQCDYNLNGMSQYEIFITSFRWMLFMSSQELPTINLVSNITLERFVNNKLLWFISITVAKDEESVKQNIELLNLKSKNIDFFPNPNLFQPFLLFHKISIRRHNNDAVITLVPLFLPLGVLWNWWVLGKEQRYAERRFTQHFKREQVPKTKLIVYLSSKDQIKSENY